MHTRILQLYKRQFDTLYYCPYMGSHPVLCLPLLVVSCCCGSFHCFWFRGRGCSCTTKKPFKCYNVLKLVVRLSTIDPTKVGPPAASHCDTSIQTSDSGVQATSPKFPPVFHFLVLAYRILKSMQHWSYSSEEGRQISNSTPLKFM